MKVAFGILVFEECSIATPRSKLCWTWPEQEIGNGHSVFVRSHGIRVVVLFLRLTKTAGGKLRNAN